MGSSSGSNVHHQLSLEMPPPLPIKRKLDDRQPPEQSLFSSDASHTPEEPRSNFDQIPESPTACAGHQQNINAVGTKKKRENEKAGNDFRELFSFGKVSSTDDMSLRAIAGDDVGKISAKMKCLTDDSRKNIEKELIVILEGNGDSQKREYLMLQKLVQSRTDLTAETLDNAHRSQLDILVAIYTGSPAFLQTRTSFCLSRTSLIEIFEQKRCRNVQKCDTLLPANNCVCMTCNNKKGFCNLCMCLICNKYEFKVNTDISCNMCSHKIHKDCAMRNGLTGKSKAHPSKMVFRCRDCSKLIDLIIESCCKAWDREGLIKDFDSFSRILHRSDNPGQKELFLKCEGLKDKMKSGTILSSITGRELLMFFEELSMDAPQSVENGEGGKLIAPQEAGNQIAEVERKNMPCYPERTIDLGEGEEEQPQILVDFFRTHPAVQTRIESFSKGIQTTFSERLTTLLHRLHFVKVRDFNEAVRAEVQEAWKDLTGAGCELQDLEPAVNQALHAEVKIREREEKLETKMQALQRKIQVCRDTLDNPPLYNSDDHFV